MSDSDDEEVRLREFEDIHIQDEYVMKVMRKKIAEKFVTFHL